MTVPQARRLALVRAGLLKPELIGLRIRAAGRGRRVRQRCHAVIDCFGYLQLDSVAVTGARSHAIVLASRLEAFDARVGESLLGPGEPLFEYWGHEACWLPMSLYPTFDFRRRAFRTHPWWGDVLGEHPRLAADIVRRIEQEGPLRSVDFEGTPGLGFWNLKLAQRVLEALWSAGDLAIRERRGFQRTFDLTARVIPAAVREQATSGDEAFDTLLLKALEGHGWCTTGTLAATWRLVNCREEIKASLGRLVDSGRVVPCELRGREHRAKGWIRCEDLELASRLDALRPRRERGVLLSPFDPVLWDRERVRWLFEFDQVLEIYKPRRERRYGYYCTPVLAGDRLVARVDLKADRRAGRLQVLAVHFEHTGASGRRHPRDGTAVDSALARFAAAVALELAR